MTKILKTIISICILTILCACSNDSSKNIIDYDVDMIDFGTQMTYATVKNIMQSADQYLGKTIRLKGIYQVVEGPLGTYHLCMVTDETACCQQGIEFILKDGNYPKINEEIIVDGTLASYQENGQLYCTLAGANIEKGE